MSKVTHKAISSFEGSNNIRTYNKGIVNVSSSSSTDGVDTTNLFKRTVNFTSDDIGYTTSTNGGGVFDSPITSEKSEVSFDVTGAQTFRSTATDGDPTMLNGVERGGSNSAVDVIPIASTSQRGIIRVGTGLNITETDKLYVTNYDRMDRVTNNLISQAHYYQLSDRNTWRNLETGLVTWVYPGASSMSVIFNKKSGSCSAMEFLTTSYTSDSLYFRTYIDSNRYDPLLKVWCEGNRITNAVWNDYAELFERGSKTEPGDLIALDVLSDKECYILASKTNNRVVGVHSDEYGFLIGGDKQPETEDFLQYNLPRFIPVGLCGRCHVKVTGTCKKGDYLVPSNIPGVAEVHNEKVDSILTIFGIACENKTSEDIDKVRVYLK